MDREPVAIGLRAHKGGALLVAIRLDGSEPRMIHSADIPLHDGGDPLAFEPVRTACAMPRAADGKGTAEAAETLAEGRRRQDEAASAALSSIAGELGASRAALLVNRAGWIEDLLGYSLGWEEHVAVAELLAVRGALRAGCRASGLALSEQDEKSLPERAGVATGLRAEDIDARLKALGAGVKPWRKEHKFAALAAWMALAEAERV